MKVGFRFLFNLFWLCRKLRQTFLCIHKGVDVGPGKTEYRETTTNLGWATTAHPHDDAGDQTRASEVKSNALITAIQAPKWGLQRFKLFLFFLFKNVHCVYSMSIQNLWSWGGSSEHPKSLEHKITKFSAKKKSGFWYPFH